MLTRSMAVRLASGVMNKREASPRFEDPIHFEDPIATKFPYMQPLARLPYPIPLSSLARVKAACSWVKRSSSLTSI